MRHLSHLYPLFPGNQITPSSTPELAQAARVSLQRRLKYAGLADSPFTGWGLAWAIALWARLEDGDSAWESLKTLMNHSTNENLLDDVLDTHPPGVDKATTSRPPFIFEIDANFGTPAAIAEMLLQSHHGEIAFLPALPQAWSHGKVTGLKARGGAEVDLEWSSTETTTAVVRILAAHDYHFRAPKGKKFASASRTSPNGTKKIQISTDDPETLSVVARTRETYHFEFVIA
jgi:alpha-L-fucosidase 2